MKPIDGTELKKHIESTICYGCEIGHVVTPCGRCYVTDLLRYMEEMPEVDAKPIKHDKWIVSSDGYYPYCSNCGARPQKMTKFCAECGCKMRKAVNDEID